MATALTVAVATLRVQPVRDGTLAEPILATPQAVPVAPPLDAAILPSPVPYVSPYVRGTGGTPFVVSSGIEKPYVALPFQPYPLRPVISPYAPPETSGDQNAQQIVNPNQPVPAQPTKPLPPGTKVVMPVLTGQQPTKAPVPAGVEEVPTPGGPVRGTIAGFDLATIPWWGWAVVAVVGAKVLLR